MSTTKNKKKVPSPMYDTDRAARCIFDSLLRDFQLQHGQTFAVGAENAMIRGVKEFRAYEWPQLGLLSPARYKAWWQLRHLLKKYRFANDMYTDDQLDQLLEQKFRASQIKFSVPLQRTPVVTKVLQEARRITREILGPLNSDPEEPFALAELMSSVRFGKRASIGCPFQRAYVDHKLTEPKAFTCSTPIRGWFFDEYVKEDPVMRRIVKNVFKQAKASKKKRMRLGVDFLKLVSVPKSWKTWRGITPLTLLALFFSYGLGAMITRRLKENGLDISRAQEKHKYLAQKYSHQDFVGDEKLSHVTVDLSDASNSMMSWHLNATFPREWYVQLRKTFVREIVLPSGESTYAESILPMGNGCTFPVETLYFYSLIKAVGNLLGVKGTYKVYGDDLIYPKRIHAHVVGIFRRLGIVVNEDKTFVDSFFRESCGGDYYRGVDVRPAILPEEHGAQKLSKTRYVAFLYKSYNALTARWDRSEISQTLDWILDEVASITAIHRVPPSWPATAGIKTSESDLWSEDHRPDLPWAMPLLYFEDGTKIWKFSYLAAVKKKRFVVDEQPFYWEWLAASPETREPQRLLSQGGFYRFWDSWLDTFEPRGETSLELCEWDPELPTKVGRPKPRLARRSKEGVLYRATCVQKGAFGFRNQKGSVVDWT